METKAEKKEDVPKEEEETKSSPGKGKSQSYNIVLEEGDDQFHMETSS